MNKLLACALAIATALGTTAMLSNNKGTIHSNEPVQARLESDGAFRDGFYLGKLAAESGRPMRPSVGRWSTDEDRARFVSGFRRGYNESLINFVH